MPLTETNAGTSHTALAYLDVEELGRQMLMRGGIVLQSGIAFKAGAVMLMVPGLLLCSGCVVETSHAGGSFDKTLEVTGPLRLEVSNNSGKTVVRAGSAGRVEIHGQIQADSWPWDNGTRRVEEISNRPPIEQHGDMVRISTPPGLRGVSIDYVISVPAETELKANSSSGDFEVHSIRGPANFTTSSGDLTISAISGDAQIATSSGDVHLDDIAGNLDVTTSSGDVEARTVHGTQRVHTTSGDVTLSKPGHGVTVITASGDVTVQEAAGDLQIHTSSGGITLDGNPTTSSYWEIRSSSGDVELRVPSSAGFMLHLRSSSGDIETSIPLVIDEKNTKHELRAHVGTGAARVEVETTSGEIKIQ
jgi:hypothetical protein